MAVVADSSIYSQLRTINPVKSYMQGVENRNNLDLLAGRREEMQRQKLERQQKSEAQQAYGLGLIQNPDGTTSYDINRVQSRLGELAPNNPYAAELMYGLAGTQYSREQDAAKMQADAQTRAMDEQYKRAQMGKLREETNQLRMKPAQQKEIKQNQAIAAGFGRRVEQAEEVMRELEKSGYNRADLSSSAITSLPNWMQSKEAQMQGQAERNFVNAVLRRESGAAISASEFESAEKQYFPRAGDSPEVLAQKAANRAQAMSMFKAEAGHAWDAIPLESPNRNPLKQRPTDPPIGKTQGGYKYLGGDPSDQRNWEKI